MSSSSSSNSSSSSKTVIAAAAERQQQQQQQVVSNKKQVNNHQQRRKSTPLRRRQRSSQTRSKKQVVAKSNQNQMATTNDLQHHSTTLQTTTTTTATTTTDQLSSDGCRCDTPTSEEPSRLQSANQSTTATQTNVCAACLKPIRERYLLVALDKQWHEDCLKCACCDCRLGEVGSTLFTHADKILCRRDFLRIFGQAGHCAACKKAIPPYELVMRAQDNAYHMDCFACQQCQYRFCVGDRFYLTDSHRIVCTLCQSEAAAAAASSTTLGAVSNAQSTAPSSQQQQQQQQPEAQAGDLADEVAAAAKHAPQQQTTCAM